jgi:NAD dependent epimerase/dehydratase
MNINGLKCLVTGAGGFIGSHLVERLVNQGASVKAMIRYTSKFNIGLMKLIKKEFLSEVEIISGDLRDSSTVRAAVKGSDAVYHLGALISIPYSYVNPREVIENNIIGTLNVIEAVRDEDVRRMIHTSTSEVYGSAIEVPIKENHPLQAQSPYSASKIGADKIVESYRRAFDVPVLTLRPFNTYGPRQSARAIIPTIISQALAGGKIHLGNLNPTRDFTFVTDTVSAFIKAMTTEDIIGQEINIGSNYQISMKHLADRISSLMGKPVKIVTDNERVRPRLSEVERLQACNLKAMDLMGWSPQIGLDEGLTETIAWIQNHQDYYNPEVYQI